MNIPFAELVPYQKQEIRLPKPAKFVLGGRRILDEAFENGRSSWVLGGYSYDPSAAMYGGTYNPSYGGGYDYGGGGYY